MGINEKSLFSFIPIEQPFEQWSRAAQAKFVPTRVAVSAGNKRLVNGSCPKGKQLNDYRVNRRAIGHAQRKTPSPFGYSCSSAFQRGGVTK